MTADCRGDGTRLRSGHQTRPKGLPWATFDRARCGAIILVDRKVPRRIPRQTSATVVRLDVAATHVLEEFFACHNVLLRMTENAGSGGRIVFRADAADGGIIASGIRRTRRQRHCHSVKRRGRRSDDRSCARQPVPKHRKRVRFMSIQLWGQNRNSVVGFHEWLTSPSPVRCVHACPREPASLSVGKMREAPALRFHRPATCPTFK